MTVLKKRHCFERVTPFLYGLLALFVMGGSPQAGMITTVDPLGDARPAFITRDGDVLIMCNPATVTQKMGVTTPPETSDVERFVKLDLPPIPAKSLSNQTILLEDGSVWVLLPPENQDSFAFCREASVTPYRLKRVIESGVVKIASNHGFVLALYADGTLRGWGNPHMRGLGNFGKEKNIVRGIPIFQRPGEVGFLDDKIIWRDYEGTSFGFDEKSEFSSWRNLNVFSKIPASLSILSLNFLERGNEYYVGDRYDLFKSNGIKEELPDFKIVDISVSQTHYMALSESGIVYVWGFDHAGQFGDVDWVPYLVGSLIERGITNRYGVWRVRLPITDVRRLIAGSTYSFVETASGQAWYWGGLKRRNNSDDFDDLTSNHGAVFSTNPNIFPDFVDPKKFTMPLTVDDSREWFPVIDKQGVVQIFKNADETDKYLSGIKHQSGIWVSLEDENPPPYVIEECSGRYVLEAFIDSVAESNPFCIDSEYNIYKVYLKEIKDDDKRKTTVRMKKISIAIVR